FDSSHVGYGLACLFWVWGLSRGRLFDLVPIARDLVFESLAEAVLVLDSNRRVLDANAAARRLFGRDGPLPGVALSDLVGAEVAAGLERSGRVALLGRMLEVDTAKVRS